MSKHKTVSIIGAGPAGIAAAIQLAHFGISFHFFEKNKLGGLLNSAGRVDNYPGIVEAKPGRDLIQDFKNHLERKKIEITYIEVTKIEQANKKFIVYTEKSNYSSDFVILATGTLPKEAKALPKSLNKNELIYDISTCFEFKELTIGIIGGGDAAFDAALSLCKDNKIVILNKNSQPKAFKELVNKVTNTDSIKYLENISILEQQTIDNKIYLKYSSNSASASIKLDKILVTAGRKPHTKLLEKLNNNKNLLKEGLLYTIGDMNGSIYRQTGIAVGEGIKVSMKINQLVNKIES